MGVQVARLAVEIAVSGRHASAAPDPTAVGLLDLRPEAIRKRLGGFPRGVAGMATEGFRAVPEFIGLAQHNATALETGYFDARLFHLASRCLG